MTGFDLAPAFVESARARAEKAGLSDRIEFLCGDLSGVRAKFDLVVSTCSLHHWRHPARMLRAMGGLLNDGGQVWLLDDSGDVSAEDRRKWVERVESSFDAGSLFRTVFGFECRYLAYTEVEVRRMCQNAGLAVRDFRIRDVFFMAKCAPAGESERTQTV